ncbi:dihydrofolate reductase [Limosilactobacillus sp. BG-MG3-A]|uniref:Dihydrofolate reductase n=1 Tax=Limosilactobacillus agrestis TaxID=2759748 RepID=A0A7W3UIJ3_9LACO|nr:dihydrofolate reductase [Limosilactobacillus agrestis]MBB1096237.1 dihydrofolate reductase [Limosilactobacillus agrestis]
MSELNLIWAEDLNGWIGKDNTIPWHVSADMKHFKTKTTNHPIIMGRKTFASLRNKSLTKRENIVLTSQDIDVRGVKIVHSLTALKEYLNLNPDEYFVIGGAMIYQQLLPLATKLTRTVINKQIVGDTKMPTIDYDRWHLVNSSNYEKDDQLICRFEEWELNV